MSSKVKIGDYVKIRTGKLDANTAEKDGKYPFFTCAVEPLAINTFSYECECVLVAGNGDLNVKYYNGRFEAYQRTYIIESVDKRKLSVPYLYRFFEKYVETLREQSIGGVIKYIKLGNLTGAKIYIPSLDKQEKIVEKIALIDEILNNRRHQLELLKDLVKSRFIEMFGDENNSFGWNIVNVEDVADVQVGVVIKPAQYYTASENGIKTFRSLNVGPMYIKDSEWVYFSEEGNNKNKKSILKENDLLIVRSGAPGTACVVPKEYEGCNAIDIIIAHPHLDKVNPYYLCAYTNLPHGKKQIEEGTSGAAQQHFNVGKYNKLKLVLPPMDKQEEFVRFIVQVDKSKYYTENTIRNIKVKVQLGWKKILREYTMNTKNRLCFVNF